VWPPAARSFLIDTVILGFPMPTLSLLEKFDLQSRKVHKEIVDGQQRSRAILDFFRNEMVLTKPSKFAGSRYDDLDDEYKLTFAEYRLHCDVFTGVTD
jgi:hypothetical protein